MGFVLRTARWFVTFVATALVFLATARDACDDDLAPDLERCSSILGNPTYEWSFLPPAVIAIAAGCAVYGLLSLLGRFWRTQRAALDSAGVG